MNEINSVALTKKVVLTASKPIKKEEFLNKILEFSNKLIKFLDSNGCSKLGHIKFISTTDGEDYLQVSVLDFGEEPAIKGVLRKTFTKINITLNIIEFGVDKENITNKINKEFQNIESCFNPD